MAIMGFPKYKIVKGKIFFKDEDITNMSIYERARRGIGIALQKPPAIKGVTLKKIIEILNMKICQIKILKRLKIILKN